MLEPSLQYKPREAIYNRTIVNDAWHEVRSKNKKIRGSKRMYGTSNGMGLGYQDPWQNQKMVESAIRVEEHSRKAEIDIGKAATLLEVSTNLKVDLQTQRMKVHFDEEKKAFTL